MTWRVWQVSLPFHTASPQPPPWPKGRIGTVSQSMNPEEPAAAKADGAANDSRFREGRRLGDYCIMYYYHVLHQSHAHFRW